MDFIVYSVLIITSALFSFIFIKIGYAIRRGSIGCLIQFPLSVLASVSVTDVLAINYIYDRVGSTYSIAIMFHLIVSSVVCIITMSILSTRLADGS